MSSWTDHTEASVIPKELVRVALELAQVPVLELVQVPVLVLAQARVLELAQVPVLVLDLPTHRTARDFVV